MDIGHLSLDASPYLWRTWKILELTTTQIDSRAPLPWPNPCEATLYPLSFPPKMPSDIPCTVLV